MDTFCVGKSERLALAFNKLCAGGRRPATPTQLHHSPQTIDNHILDSANGLKYGLPSSSDGETTEFATVTNPSVDHRVPGAEMPTVQVLDLNMTGSQGAIASEGQRGKGRLVESTGSMLNILKRIGQYICFQKGIGTIRSREALESSPSHTPAIQQFGGNLTNLDGLAEPADGHEHSTAISRSFAELIPDLTIEAPKAASDKSPDSRLERETAVRNIGDGSFYITVVSTPGNEQPEEHIARPLETAQILPVPDILEPVFTEQTQIQGKLDSDRPIVQTLELASSQQPQRTAASTLQNVVHLPQPYDFKTTFRMVIHRADNQVAQRVFKLDTASMVNVISEQVVTSLGLAMKPYDVDGPSIAPLGPPIRPVGEIEIDWHIACREKTYTTKFAVLDNSLTKDFDVLLGVDTIKEIGFYKVNNAVWFGDILLPAPSSQQAINTY